MVTVWSAMRGKLVVLIVPTIMILVALAHGWRVSQHDESPWIGAGFGMFAAIDGPQRVVVIDQADGGTIRLPANMSQRLATTANYPVPSAFESLGRQLRDRGIHPERITVLRPVYDKGGLLSWTEVVSHEYE